MIEEIKWGEHAFVRQEGWYICIISPLLTARAIKIAEYWTVDVYSRNEDEDDDELSCRLIAKSESGQAAVDEFVELLRNIPLPDGS